MSATTVPRFARRFRRSAAQERPTPQGSLSLLCRVSRAVGWLLTGEQQMLCSMLHLNGWYRLAAITDLICYQREGMSFHCARMAEMEARLGRIERRRSARAATRTRPSA